jgi:short-subunit dehydrogenase
MLARRRGHVVNVASFGGKKGAPFEAVYSATKAGLIEWTSALRSELESTGVCFSAICPGYVTGEGMFAKFGVSAPRTIGSCTPEQVAAAVVDAIRRDRPEVIVNSMPVRPLLALNALSPRLGLWLLEAMGITAFQRRKVGGAEVR